MSSQDMNLLATKLKKITDDEELTRDLEKLRESAERDIEEKQWSSEKLDELMQNAESLVLGTGPALEREAKEAEEKFQEVEDHEDTDQFTHNERDNSINKETYWDAKKVAVQYKNMFTKSLILLQAMIRTNDHLSDYVDSMKHKQAKADYTSEINDLLKQTDSLAEKIGKEFTSEMSGEMKNAFQELADEAENPEVEDLRDKLSQLEEELQELKSGEDEEESLGKSPEEVEQE